MLPSDLHKPSAQLILIGANRYQISALLPVHARRATCDPFTLTTFLYTLQPTTSAKRLIHWLQHSILGVWLALTQAGFTPASQSDLASPHVHHLVRQWFAVNSLVILIIEHAR